MVWDDDFGAWTVDNVVVLAECTETEGKSGERKVQKVGSGSQAEWWVRDVMLFANRHEAV